MFSVVIPLYNKAHIISQTLASIFSQTYQEFEIIVVNDGSTDNSAEVVNEVTTSARLRLINQKNQGVSAARNRGVLEAKFKYIAFLDGDDEWAPGFLQKVKEAIELFPEAGMFGTSSIHRNIVTGVEKDSTLLRYKNQIQQVDYFENPASMSHTSATVVAKSVFTSIDKNGEGFPVGMKCCEDWSCFYRAALKAPVVYIGFPLGIRNNNVKGQITGLSSEERFNYLKHVVDFYNLTYDNYLKQDIKPKNYLIHLRYDLRHRIIVALRSRDYRTLEYLLYNLDDKILNHFSKIEIAIYLKRWMPYVGIGYIYWTKIIWRRHGYPIVGKPD